MIGIATARRPGDVQMLEAHESPQYCDDARRRHKRGDGSHTGGGRRRDHSDRQQLHGQPTDNVAASKFGFARVRRCCR